MEDHELLHQVAVPVITGLVELAKRTFKLPTRVAPLIALALGISAAFLVHSDGPVRGVLEGLVFGLEACGLYSGAKALEPVTLWRREKRPLAAEIRID